MLKIKTVPALLFAALTVTTALLVCRSTLSTIGANASVLVLKLTTTVLDGKFHWFTARAQIVYALFPSKLFSVKLVMFPPLESLTAKLPLLISKRVPTGLLFNPKLTVILPAFTLKPVTIGDTACVYVATTALYVLTLAPIPIALTLK